MFWVEKTQFFASHLKHINIFKKNSSVIFNRIIRCTWVVGHFGTRAIWHQDSKNGQFGPKKANGQFSTKIRKRTIWHQHSKNGQFGIIIRNGQFGTAIFWDNFQRNQGAWSQLSSPITVPSYLWVLGWVIENNPIVTFCFLQPSTSEELCGSQIFALEQLGSAMGHLSTTKCTLQKSR